MAYLEYCKNLDPNIQPGTFAAQQRLARYERDELLAKQPPLAGLCVCVSQAVEQAIGIAALSRSAQAISPTIFIGHFVRLEAWLDQLTATKDAPQLLSKWPENPNIRLGLTAGVSALDIAWRFAKSIYTAVTVARAMHRIPSHGEPYASKKAVDECGPDIAAWSELAMKELKETTLPLATVWPTMGNVRVDGQQFKNQLGHEISQGLAASPAAKGGGDEPTMSVAEAAKALQLDKGTIRKLCNSRELQATKDDHRRWRIMASSAKQYTPSESRKRTKAVKPLATERTWYCPHCDEEKIGYTKPLARCGCNKRIWLPRA
jgi:excisionase family DNA binding protein